MIEMERQIIRAATWASLIFALAMGIISNSPVFAGLLFALWALTLALGVNIGMRNQQKQQDDAEFRSLLDEIEDEMTNETAAQN